MSYSINLSGHGAKAEDVERIFKQTVHELRKANEKGDPSPHGHSLGGSASGSDPEGNTFRVNAADVEHEDL